MNESLEAPSKVARLSSFECWGKILAGRPCRCGDYNSRGQIAFYSRFCAACHHHGILVPADRVRMLSTPPSLANSASNGVWSEHRVLPRYRIVNQTKRCRGPSVIIFEAPLSGNLQKSDDPAVFNVATSAPLPAEWCATCPHSGAAVISFILSHSSLVPMHATGLNSTRDLPMTRTDPAVARMPPPDMPAEPHTAPLHVAQGVPQLQPVLQQHMLPLQQHALGGALPVQAREPPLLGVHPGHYEALRQSALLQHRVIPFPSGLPGYEAQAILGRHPQHLLQQPEAVQTVASPLHYAPHASAFHSVQQFFPVEYGMRDDGRFTAGAGHHPAAGGVTVAAHVALAQPLPTAAPGFNGRYYGTREEGAAA